MGVQLVQLSAMLTTAMVFDLLSGELRPSDSRRLVGFSLVTAGVIVSNISGAKELSDFNVTAAIYLIGVYASGVGFVLQAKCTGTLAEDVGGVVRATTINAIVTGAAVSPFVSAVWFSRGVKPMLSAEDWHLWLFVGAQSAFYIGSIGILPKALGYTSSYLALLLGKLTTSSAADAMGLTGRAVPFGWWRGASLLLVVLGATLFSVKSETRPSAGGIATGREIIDKKVVASDMGADKAASPVIDCITPAAFVKADSGKEK